MTRQEQSALRDARAWGRLAASFASKVVPGDPANDWRANCAADAMKLAARAYYEAMGRV